MGQVKKVWQTVVLPFEMFKQGTRGGGVVFRVQTGDFQGYEFVRPLVLVRASREKPGFSVAYSIEQSIDANGEVLEEVVENVKLSKSQKVGEKYQVVDEFEMPMNQLESIV